MVTHSKPEPESVERVREAVSVVDERRRLLDPAGCRGAREETAARGASFAAGTAGCAGDRFGSEPTAAHSPCRCPSTRTAVSSTAIRSGAASPSGCRPVFRTRVAAVRLRQISDLLELQLVSESDNSARGSCGPTWIATSGIRSRSTESEPIRSLRRSSRSGTDAPGIHRLGPDPERPSPIGKRLKYHLPTFYQVG